LSLINKEKNRNIGENKDLKKKIEREREKISMFA